MTLADTTEVNHQLSFAWSADSTPRHRKTTPRANRTRKTAGGVLQPPIPGLGNRFLPLVGTPRTRKDCPDTTKQFCPYVRCRWNLAREDADHRAGRPGLAHVPRDARGWTLPVTGNAGAERAGTTVEPRWLELERRCQVWTERDNDDRIVAVNALYENEWDNFFRALHPGEPIEAQRDDGTVIAMVDIKPDQSIVLDRDPQEFLFRLVRKRGVPSCAMDEILRNGKMSNEQVGDAIGRHRTLVAREVRRALVKLRAKGVDLRDLLLEGQ